MLRQKPVDRQEGDAAKETLHSYMQARIMLMLLGDEPVQPNEALRNAPPLNVNSQSSLPGLP